ncbi:MAG TPA: TRAP transporter substrate-binding protein [Hyphomicrobiales bacterium]|nr:TRAP transporter substrate-binding protein [Kaistiaceae bacterium]HQF29876.1 TRAP transporter substrate-binding protein [Hyphomicrobiales bacterium]
MFRRPLAVAAILTAALLAASGAVAAEVTLRVHHFLSAESSVPRDFIAPWGKRLEEASGGRIAVEVYPAMQLGGKPSSLYDQARDGVVDVVWTLAGYTPGRFPKTEVFDLPFVATDAAETSKAAWEFFDRHLRDEYADVHVLTVHVHSPGVLHVRGRTVKTLEDMKGLKLRGATRMVTKLLEGLGSVAVGMPAPAIPEALSKGVIDGAALPWEVTGSLHVAELVDGHTTFWGRESLYTTMFLFVMNKARYDGLPDDLKKIVDDSVGAPAAAEIGRIMDAADVPSIEIAAKRGNEIVTLDEAETARFKAASDKVAEDWIAEMDKKGIDGRALYDDARALIAKYATK